MKGPEGAEPAHQSSLAGLRCPFVLSPLKDGIVADWDIVDSIWDHAFSRECLLIDPKEHPMLLAEPSSNPQQQRERAAELMFEKYKAPALFLAKNAVLTSFASGHATSLVVDRELIPVPLRLQLREGSLMAVATSPIGGEFLTDCLMKSLESKGIAMKPRYSFRRKEIRPGEFQLAGGTASMQQLKERLEKDLLEESPQAARVKVLASGNATERRFSVWIGGSILASLGSFQQMWFSKSEYEEHGASYIQRKCP
ncbi:actin-related protein [Trifolium repens]|nr:actin-related protein [Trifolium repens]